MELWVILCNFWPILKNSSSIKPLTRNHSYLVWRVPRGSSFFKFGRCDLYLRFKLTIFAKHIFDFSQTAAQILIKFGSYMHLSKVTQVCSNQGCKTYFYWIMLISFWVVTQHVYLQCKTISHYVISHCWLLFLNRCTDLLQILCGCSLGVSLLSLLKSGCYP